MICFCGKRAEKYCSKSCREKDYYRKHIRKYSLEDIIRAEISKRIELLFDEPIEWRERKIARKKLISDGHFPIINTLNAKIVNTTMTL